jgi:oxygen-dependent protoporphyrinogen oxidase
MTAPPAIPALLDAPDPVAANALVRSAAPYVHGLEDALTATFVHRFRHGLPEATPEALGLRAGFAGRAPGPVDYAGDWEYLRPSSEGAVRSAAAAAARVRAHLHARSRAKEAV